MQRGQSIHPYFEGKAPDYDRRSRRGIWAKVRRAEGSALSRLLGAVNGTELLDLGCGTGFYSARLRDKGARVFGVDSSRGMIEELRRKGIEGACADVNTLRLGRKFHVILAAGLVEFLESERRLFTVARSHVVPGGRFVLLAPRSGLPGLVYEMAHTWMGCRAVARSVETLEAAANATGWELEKVRGAGPLAVALRFRERSLG